MYLSWVSFEMVGVLSVGRFHLKCVHVVSGIGKNYGFNSGNLCTSISAPLLCKETSTLKLSELYLKSLPRELHRSHIHLVLNNVTIYLTVKSAVTA